MFIVKSNVFMRVMYPKRYWKVNTRGEKKIYLTFDDGPHPDITSFVLQQLRAFDAKATFFCVGKNVQLFPAIYEQLLNEGHAVGNHTHNHLNGWKTEKNSYVDNILQAQQYIQSTLFRPPYGRMSYAQERLFMDRFPHHKIIMWDILSGDFDRGLSGEKVFQNVIRYVSKGSIIVFHDSEKAFERLAYALPRCLNYFAEQKYSFGTL